MTRDGSILVFAGPSLPPESRPDDARFVWRPPAVAGDTYRLAADDARTVVLIDGLFDESPAIRHREILELLARGVFVLGGASMGALRAAELAEFGMIGVGRIFDAYARGNLVGDDEVALVHGPEDWSWAPLTEALVNVRATLVRALREFVIDVEAARLVLTTARAMFYKTRTWPEILAAVASSDRLGSARAAALRDWLAAGRVDLKRQDALACLDRAVALDGQTPPPRPSPPRSHYAEALAARVRGL